jgi:hypothetical protein
MEQLIPTPDTKLAAVLATLGFPLKLRDVHDEQSGRTDYTWQITPISVSRPSLSLAELLKLYRSGELETKDPEHPFLDGMHALRNRERILTLIKEGRSITLAECPGGKRTCYVHHAAVEVPASFGRFVTRDFRLVCALGRMGIPLVSWQGVTGSHEWTLAKRSVLPGLKLDAATVSLALEQNTLGEDHPIRFCIKALENHSRCLNAIAQSKSVILIRKPRSMRAAWIHQDATDHAFERIAKHFRV